MSDCSTHAFDVPLKPCPFCGGEAYHYAPGPIEHHIACKNYKECGADIERDTEAEAIAAWNSRAELGSEPPYDELLRCLENDWNISASWDGLRRFWHIGLTEEGVRLRDATTMLEALVRDMWFKNIGRMDSCGWCVIGCNDAECCELQERMAALGLFDGDAE